MELYVVGLYVSPAKNGSVWDFVGVFDDLEKATKACKSSNYFIGPCTLNAPFPDEREKWPGIHYPIKAKRL